MKKTISKILLVTAFVLGIIGSLGFSAFASDDDHGFYLLLYGNYANDYTSARYRQTASSDNPWKVNLTYNSEGDGCIATFWIHKSGYGVVSKTHDVKQGTGAHYYKDISSQGNQSNVMMGVENNNNTNTTYNVSGAWDEETW